MIEEGTADSSVSIVQHAVMRWSSQAVHRALSSLRAASPCGQAQIQAA